MKESGIGCIISVSQEVKVLTATQIGPIRPTKTEVVSKRMYGIPPHTDLGFLKNLTLLQACFGENELILNFSGNATLSILSSIGIESRAGLVRRYSRFIEAASFVLKGVGKLIIDVSWEEDGTVTLYFDNGHKMYIYDDSSDCESFIVAGPGTRIIV